MGYFVGDHLNDEGHRIDDQLVQEETDWYAERGDWRTVEERAEMFEHPQGQSSEQWDTQHRTTMLGHTAVDAA